MSWWYVSRNGETVGPVPDQAVAAWISQGMRGAMLCDARGGPWVPLERSPFASMLAPRPERGGSAGVDVDDVSPDTGTDFWADSGASGSSDSGSSDSGSSDSGSSDSGSSGGD